MKLKLRQNFFHFQNWNVNKLVTVCFLFVWQNYCFSFVFYVVYKNLVISIEYSTSYRFNHELWSKINSIFTYILFTESLNLVKLYFHIKISILFFLLNSYFGLPIFPHLLLIFLLDFIVYDYFDFAN